MKFLRASWETVLGLFVADWTQTAGILLILVLGYAAMRRLHEGALGFVFAVALALHLVFTTTSEARRRA
ncbi:MAG: hypothetical protein ACYDGR_15200, partial [Candidatus Dormibacteria bacterium]